MIDVFFCSLADSDDLRANMAQLCEARWALVDRIAFYPIDDDFLKCSPRGFQRLRRMYADQNAESEIYIVTDDDCLLPADFNLDECVRIFKESGFATLSLLPSNAQINKWTPEKYQAEDTPDVFEHFSAGQVRFCKKGHMQEWPPMDGGPGYDAIHGAQIRKQGGRVGYFKNHKALHLGENYSQVWTPEAVQC